MADEQDRLTPVTGAHTLETADDRQHEVAEIGLSDEMVLAALAEHAHAARGAYAANTERALRADTAVFTAWCGDAGLAPLPNPARSQLSWTP